jgi:choline kinase
MRTIILAAGQGTRLRPYTNDKPKCMVSLAGQPLLHHQLDAMAACGVQQGITLVGGYLSDRLVGRNAEVVINPRYAETNMVQTLFCARHAMVPGEDLLISYGDIVYEPRVLQAVLDCDAPVALAADQQWQRLWKLRMDEPLDDAETFVMDDQQRVLSLGKKPQSYDEVQAQYMGLFRIRADYVERMMAAFDALDPKALYDGKDLDNMYMTSFVQHLIDLGWPVQACLVDNGWLEVDTASELEAYEAMAQDGSLDQYCQLGKTR